MSANLTPDAFIERNRPGKSAGVKNAPARICQCFFVCAFSNGRYMRLKSSCAWAWRPRPRHLSITGRLVDVMHMQYGQGWENRVFPRKVFH